eukprot:gene18303-23988_t
MNGSAELLAAHKQHKKSKVGAKANKRKSNISSKDKQKNAKAFNVSNLVRTKRIQQRNLDRMQKKELVPLINRTESEDNAPPTVIVVMGPKGVGKSTLIRSLVKMYTKQNIIDCKGPITVLAGKKKRFTFFESPLDIYSMTDLAKVADIVLLMIDASYGFEMETFEFLNQLQLHGFPKVIGILTHLDGFIRKNKLLQNTKKAIKHRFWTEIYDGAKIFDLSGVVHNKYLKHEIKRLSLTLMRTKCRPLVWRNSHSYLLIDRVEDITSNTKVQEDSKCNRDVALYGYVRGTHLKIGSSVHLIGAGDFAVDAVKALDDPCPLPLINNDGSGTVKRTSLKAKDSLLYAPMANVGRVSMDKDGMYIDIKYIHYTKPENLQLGDSLGVDNRLVTNEVDSNTPMGMLRQMQDIDSNVNHLIDKSELSLFPSSQRVKSIDMIGSDNDSYTDNDADVEDEEDDGEDEDDEEESNDEEYNDNASIDENENDSEHHIDEDDDYYKDDNEDHNHSSSSWKSDMKSKALSAYNERALESQANDLMTQVYGSQWTLAKDKDRKSSSHKRNEEVEEQENDNENDEDFFILKNSSNVKYQAYKQANAIDSSRYSIPRNQLISLDKSIDSIDQLISEYKAKLSMNLRVCKEGQKGIVDGNGDINNIDEDDQIYGDFEDLEATGNNNQNINKDEEMDEEVDEELDDDESVNSDDIEETNENIDKKLRELNAKRKANQRQVFDEIYDQDKINKVSDKKSKNQTEIEEEKVLETAKRLAELRKKRNKEEFGEDGELSRVTLEGFRQGLYVRIVISNVPLEFCQNFHPQLPVIVGGLQAHEATMGIVRARVKRHRWHRKILKSNDPIIISMGWRRFQTIPIYCVEDINERNRFIKYTPEHMHCICYFYGPLVPPNTPLLGYQYSTSKTANFRISMTGTVLESLASGSPNIVKKLKLIGYPMKIFKNTAFVKDMFTSALEISRFEGAKIKTVSGIRGIIKKALSDTAANGHPGSFRASFEDKILMSDIITCRLWVPVEIKQVCNPVLSLLTSDPEAWKGLRTIAQIRREEKIPIITNKDSVYKPIERIPREFAKLHIPKKLEESLPFASKPKVIPPKNRDSYLAKRATTNTTSPSEMVISKPVIIKCRKKSQEDVCQDSCFWPTMPKESVIGVLDDKNMPHISQKYIVPNPSSLLSNESNILDSNDSITKSTKLSNSSTNDSITIGAGYDPTKDYRHVEVVYSLWSHFLDFCKSDINSVVTEPRLVSPPDPCNPFNVHTCRRRLQVFQSLSQGESICYNR